MKIDNISEPDLRVFVIDNIIPEHILRYLEVQCPKVEKYNSGGLEKSVYELTTSQISESEASSWNLPAGESYLKQGMIVKPTAPVDYFISAAWKKSLARIIDVDPSKVIPTVWQYRTNTENHTGLWLHTDKDLRKNDYRNVEVLIYVSSQEWCEDHGGELLVFSNEHAASDVPRRNYKKWQTGRVLRELNTLAVDGVIRTTGIGGGWPLQQQSVDFTLERKIPPLFGRVVVLDYRNNYNIHAVAPKVNFNRKSIEQWFVCE